MKPPNPDPKRNAAAPVEITAAATPAHLGWRLLAMTYELLPMLALWLLVSALILLLRGGVAVVPWSLAFWLQAGALWLVSGGYFVGSWRRGGQTLGMRPWRLRVVTAEGGRPSLQTLVFRYALATVSLLALGFGFVWSLFDRERSALHDRFSNTRLVRMPAQQKTVRQ